MTIPKRIFISWSDAVEEYYRDHDAQSDDSDKEDALIERWIINNNYEVSE